VTGLPRTVTMIDGSIVGDRILPPPSASPQSRTWSPDAATAR
jgi:hypothetical protein